MKPVFANQEQLRKVRRLLVWECHSCGEPGFSNKIAGAQCKKCYHKYHPNDLIADSYVEEINRVADTKVRFTLVNVPEWDATMPWVFAWFGHKCENCGELVFEPYDQTNVLHYKPDHVCNKNITGAEIQRMLQLVYELEVRHEKSGEQLKELRQHITALRDKAKNL